MDGSTERSTELTPKSHAEAIFARTLQLRGYNSHLDIKIFPMNRLGIPQDRIAKRLGQTRETIRDHLPKMAALTNPVNTDLSKGVTFAGVAENVLAL